MTVRRVRGVEAAWRGVIERYSASGQSVSAFCAAESVSVQNFYRWRRRLRKPESTAGVPVIGHRMSEFVDLGRLGARVSTARMDLKLELGSWLRLHVAKG